MTALTVRIATRNVTVDALPTGVPGLMAHARTGRPGWALTHARSGNAVAIFPPDVDPEALLACARELATLADWTAPAHDLVSRLTLPQVRRIADRWGSVDSGGQATNLDDLPGMAP